MSFIKPVVGQWYRGATDELFEVVAIDDQDQTIEIQFFDGSVTEIDFEAWNEQVRDELLEAADALEDWSGAVDVEAEDLDREFENTARLDRLGAINVEVEDVDREFEDTARLDWSRHADRSLRR